MMDDSQNSSRRKFSSSFRSSTDLAPLYSDSDDLPRSLPRQNPLTESRSLSNIRRNIFTKETEDEVGALAFKSGNVSSTQKQEMKLKNSEAASIPISPTTHKQLATKEEKQRQNEEIVTVESSVPSSYDFINAQSPHSPPEIESATPTPSSEASSKFLQNNVDKVRSQNMAEPYLSNNFVTAATTMSGSCFIDASSLIDESELAIKQGAEDQQFIMDKEVNVNPLNKTKCIADSSAINHSNDKPDHLTFPKNNVRKFNSKDLKLNDHSNSSNSSSASELVLMPEMGDSDVTSNTTHTINLSDEEKLWKRSHISNKQSSYNGPLVAGDTGDTTEVSVSLAAEIDSSDSSENINNRFGNEEKCKPGPYVVQRVQSFSIHPLSTSPKFKSFVSISQANKRGGYSDISYTTDYSSSSPAPSLVWSEHTRANSGDSVIGTANRYSNDFADATLQTSKMISLLPDTPHNSIADVQNNVSNSSSLHCDYTLSSSQSHQRDSGAYFSDATDISVPLPRTSRYDESNIPTESAAENYALKADDSSNVQSFALKHDTTANINNEKNQEETLDKPKMAKATLSKATSWVVDMSNCRDSNSSLDTTGERLEQECSNLTSSHNSLGERSCGFFLPLDDFKNKVSKNSELKSMPNAQMNRSLTSKKANGFFVNWSRSETQPKELGTQVFIPEKAKNDADETSSKKQIFSLFIDIGNEKKPTHKEGSFNLAQRFSSSSAKSEDNVKTKTSSTQTLMPKSAEVIANNETPKQGNPTPVTAGILRKKVQNESTKRHSWGDDENRKANVSSNCKRSISLNNTCSEQNGLMSIIDKLPIISNTLRVNPDNSLTQFMACESEIASSLSKSNQSLSSAGEAENIKCARRKVGESEAQINQTYDISSLASITDGYLSQDFSPASTADTDDLTFQKDEELAITETIPQAINFETVESSNRASAHMMETIIEAKELSETKVSAAPRHTMETLHATIEKQKMLLETVNENNEEGGARSSFVKLSDMDVPVKLELQSPETFLSKSVSSSSHRQFHRIYRDEHSSGARPHSWTMTHSTVHRLLNITSSVDNLRSLTRLFPHFSNEISNSLPNDVTKDHLESAPTDTSLDSSMASSFSLSAMDESSISCRQPRRLGEDLLKMFLQGIATDMIVEVNGRRLRAHKCILRSRSQYFAAMLAGHDQHIVSLKGYSYSAVHFALCHIYSGASHPPAGISLMELAALADLLGLEGLKEVTAHALKINYCHNFHKPCSGCIDGILQVFPVALNHALDDLYRKCLRWTCRHYLKVWSSRQFSQLSPDLLGRCRQQIVAYLVSI